jgi:cell wall-associated NlpC family hydrolase
MSEWIYRVGLSLDEASEELLKKAGLKYELVEVESALRTHIPETLGKQYKFHTSMRSDAPNFFSCSSLISYLYMFAGVWLPSLSIDKYFYTKRIEKSDLRFGDLVFAFNPDDSGEEGHHRTTSVEYMPGKLHVDEPINHMGMYLGEGKILYASGLWYKGQVIEEDLDSSPSFRNIRGYGRVVEDLHEKRFVIEIPADRPDLRTREVLIDYLRKN